MYFGVALQAEVLSRGEELVTDKFPEFGPLAEALPDGTVIDSVMIDINMCTGGNCLPDQVTDILSHAKGIEQEPRWALSDRGRICRSDLSPDEVV